MGEAGARTAKTQALAPKPNYGLAGRNEGKKNAS